MISSLIAVSAQHYLLWSITLEHERLKNLELMDMDGQGVLTTDHQYQHQRVASKPPFQHSHLELPGGLVLKRVTLVAIGPSEVWGREVVDDGGCGSLHFRVGVGFLMHLKSHTYRSSGRMLVMKRTFYLEMSSIWGQKR
ncbi:unnamed protein product [Musa textilis]